MSTIEEQLNKLREETLASLKKISTENEKEMQNLRVSVPVSYTHLTLPTN